MTSRAIPLDKPISMKDVLSGEGFTFNVNFDDLCEDEDDLEKDYGPQLTGDISSVNLEDEDTYDCNPTPFEEIAQNMTSIGEEGLVKKRIFREGKGVVVPPGAKVYFQYKAYLEFDAAPYDSTYVRKKPFNCKLGTGSIIPGLEIAILSMKMNEKAQFIIPSQLAYGNLGCPHIIPANSELLFEIVLQSFAQLADNEPDEDSEEFQASFEPNFDKAVKLCGEANLLFSNEQKYKPAIRNYNEAINRLSNVLVHDEDQSDRYVKLLRQLYTNLAVCHLKLDHFKKCCINCQEVYKICRNYDIDVPDKVYYSHAKALLGLGEPDRADEKLKIVARNTSFDKPDKKVLDLYQAIQKAKAKQALDEKKLVQGMFLKQENTISNEFKESVESMCKDLHENSHKSQITLPDKLNGKEIAFIQETVKKHQLQLVEYNDKGQEKKFCIKKL